MSKVHAGDCSNLWKFPKEHDGWYRAHNALRADLDALESMVAAFNKQLAEGVPISPAQGTAAGRFFKAFVNFIHHHHHNEDDIAMPYLQKRCEMPAKITADHKVLEDLLEQLEGRMGKLLATAGGSVAQQKPLVADFGATLGEVRALLLEHFKEEEEIAMVLMRKHFTPKEIEKNVVSKIVRSMDGEAVGVMLRPMSKAERKGFAKQEGIPFFIFWILSFQANKHDKKVWQPFARECLRVQAVSA